MPVFERSWQNRLIRGRNILPQIRDQGQESTCSHYAVAGALEAAFKKVYAEANQAFESEISIEYLISKFHGIPLVTDVLDLILLEGTLTVDCYQQYLNDHTDVERVKIEDYLHLEPQMHEGDFVRLIVYILNCGTAIGVFLVTSSYNDDTTYYEEVGTPVLSDVSDEGGGEFETYYLNIERPFFSDVTEGEGGSEGEGEGEGSVSDEGGGEFKTYYLNIFSDVTEGGGGGEGKGEDEKDVYHAVLLISFGMDELNNFYWRVLDSHGPNAGEDGTRRIAVNLIKDAYIIVPKT